MDAAARPAVGRGDPQDGGRVGGDFQRSEKRLVKYKVKNKVKWFKTPLEA